MTPQPYVAPEHHQFDRRWATGPARQPVSNGDVAASTLLLVVAGLVYGLGGFMSLMTMAFVDGCTGTCDPDVLTRNAMLMLGVTTVAGVGGLVVTVLRLKARSLAWPCALATLVVVTAVFAVGFTIQLAP